MISEVFKHLSDLENGQTLVEYALILAVVVIAVFILAFIFFAEGISDIYQNIMTQTTPYFS